MSFSAEVAMSPELRAKLNTLATSMQSERITDLLSRGAEVIVEGARQKAPVLTGALRDSIRAEIVAGYNSMDVVIGADVPYARRIEFGFSGSDSRGRSFHQAAQPYLRPSLDENRSAALERIRDQTNVMLREIFG